MLLFRWAQCRSAQPLLWDYASERLSEEMVERVEQHLHQCASCHKELDSLKRAQGLLAACRAQEEPAPRSDWNDLQQRIVADGLAHIAPVATTRRLANPVRRERVGSASRAPWTMQLATSAAGGFAAVLVLSLGYHALHLQSVPGAVPLAEIKSDRTDMVASAPLPVSTTSEQKHEGTVDSSQTAVLVANILKAMNTGSATADNNASAKVRSETASTLPAKGGAFLKVSLRSEERRSESKFAHTANRVPPPSSHALRRGASEKSLAANKSALKFQHYDIKAKDRLPDTTPTQIASRYALERVQPVGNEGDDSNTYVVGSVRPISRDDEGVY